MVAPKHLRTKLRGNRNKSLPKADIADGKAAEHKIALDSSPNHNMILAGSTRLRLNGVAKIIAGGDYPRTDDVTEWTGRGKLIAGNGKTVPVLKIPGLLSGGAYEDIPAWTSLSAHQVGKYESPAQAVLNTAFEYTISSKHMFRPTKAENDVLHRYFDQIAQADTVVEAANAAATPRGLEETLAHLREREALDAALQQQERRARRKAATNLVFGLWKDREGGPPDGVEYQERIRSEW